MKRLLAVILTALLLTQAAAVHTVGISAASAENRRATGFLKDVVHSSGSGYEAVAISLNKYSDYSAMRLSGPDRIVIDVFNAAITGRARTVETAGELVKSIRYAQFDTYTARIVLNVEKQPDYIISKTTDGLIVYVGDTPESAAKSKDNSDSEADASIGAPEGIEGSDAGKGGNTGANKAEKQTISIHKSFSLFFVPADANDELTIALASYKGYKVTRLTGPDSLMIDIPKVKYKGKSRTASIGSRFVKSLKYSVCGKDTARIVLDLTAQNQYVVKEAKGKLVISFKEASYRNIRYHNNGDRVYFSLTGTKLTEGGDKLKKLYNGTCDKTGKTYTITFPSTQADIGSGVLRINDNYIDYLNIIKNENTKTTSICIKAAKKFTYNVFTRDKVNGTTITMLEPAKKTDKLVVIDAGHGGSATGAIYNGLYEKNLNLDIAKRLNALLKKKKVKTYMIREDDSFVGSFERAYIANDLNAAMFLSIHNNAIDDPDFGGTMTLYYPQASRNSSLTGRGLAELVHGKLLSRLGTTNRKIIERPNLVVLNATTMPSALAEVAYMTNARDRSSLKKESFRQKAAQALCDAVIQALKK